MTSVLLSDQRPTVRDQLGIVLTASTTFSTVRVVSTPRQLLAQHRDAPADLVLVGQQILHPAEIVRRLKAVHPDGAVVVLIGSAQDSALAAPSLLAGAGGILRWDGRDGRSVLRRSRELIPGVLAAEAVRTVTPHLTARELQVLQGISEGRSNSSLATSLQLTEDTVKSHARTLYRKLGARDRAQAVMIGLRLELID